ncbi:hypothetical protein JZY91_07905 [Corynebacterium sp. CNCTC7651]|uniref:hypothetical protein n=1 Tax=Corynebacterium sp. CNCTC7651 TaxID=2815361 RepID=UPI001F473B6D|nr:hypothetical protein [Corynebacterium sp. CNCTC7651]UIZ91658.1 hypothetical protein JZY91_07905 [Corynebacterium sp. CNCTC7651]
MTYSTYADFIRTIFNEVRGTLAEDIGAQIVAITATFIFLTPKVLKALDAGEKRFGANAYFDKADWFRERASRETDPLKIAILYRKYTENMSLGNWALMAGWYVYPLAAGITITTTIFISTLAANWYLSCGWAWPFKFATVALALAAGVATSLVVAKIWVDWNRTKARIPSLTTVGKQQFLGPHK